jgi:hypothetical protein
MPSSLERPMSPVTELKITAESAESRQRFCNAKTEQPGAVLIGVTLAEIAEIPSGLHPVRETARRRTGRSFGSKAAASGLRQAPPSSARRKKPAIGDSFAKTAETAQTPSSTKWCSNIRRLGGRRRTGFWPAQTAQTAETPFRRNLLIGISPAETAETPAGLRLLRVGQADEAICRTIVSPMQREAMP